MLKVYGHLSSGNCYKVFLALKQLEIPFDWEDVDAVKRETRMKADSICRAFQQCKPG